MAELSFIEEFSQQLSNFVTAFAHSSSLRISGRHSLREHDSGSRNRVGITEIYATGIVDAAGG